MKWKAACVFLALLAAGLAVLALVQWGQLRRLGMPPDWGDVPAWVSALGSVAAFGALFIASLEWRQGQADRRALEAERSRTEKARQMSQARLIVAEPVDDGMSILQGAIAADFDDADVSIANYSTEPVFDLRIVNALGSGVVVQQQFTDGPNAPTALPVLAAGQKTEPLTVAGSGNERTCEVIEFAFTDARGMRWYRRGNDMPRNFVLPDELP